MRRRAAPWILPHACCALAAAIVSSCASSPPAPVRYGAEAPQSTPAPGSPRPPSSPPLDSVAPRIVDPGAQLQCVPYARAHSGVQIFGDANTWWRQAAGRYPRSGTPAEGAVLVVKGYQTDARAHVAVVRRILSDRHIVVDHANWLNGGEISVDVPVLDVSPDNDWSKIRVWHVPGAHWGGRIYTVDGFIFPLGGILTSAPATPSGARSR